MDTITQVCTSDETNANNDQLEGVALESLNEYDTIHAHTHNSDYQIFIFDPKTGRALVQGGPYLSKPVAAVVCGSTIGGGMLKTGWLGIGLCMEIFVHGRRLVTSPVQSLSVLRDH
ncbi:MAG TPA: hypothetical protein VJ302_05645 [Blastocatellia bacterium]|nr:hypothetical protein [Blastocatellia bacterium]